MTPHYFLSALLLVSAILLCNCDGSTSGRSLSFHILDQNSNTPSLSWRKFYQNYIKNSRPVLLQKAYAKNGAYRTWSSDYIYNHYGAALTFRNITETDTVSFRNIIAQREYFMQLHLPVPAFLREDLVLPQCLDCDKLINYVDTPLWLWHFHSNTQVKLHSEKAHELWCMIRGGVSMTLIPEWTDGMIDQFVDKNILSETPQFKEIKFYEVTLRKGDCFYVPNNFLRQWQPTRVDTMAIIFRMNTSIFDQSNKQFENCEPIEEGLAESYDGYAVFGKDGATLDQVDFADDKHKKDGVVLHVEKPFIKIHDEASTVLGGFFLQMYIEKLGPDKCMDTALAKELWGVGDDLAKVSQELFDAIDTDQDGEFCWEDVDLWTFEKTRELGKLMNDKVWVIQEIWNKRKEKTKASETIGKRNNDEL